MKKIFSLLLLVVSIMLFNNTKIYADVNDSSLVRNYYDGYYTVYNAPDRVRLFYAERLTLNGNTAYCIQPGVAINTYTYSSTTDWSVTGLSDDVVRYIRLVAYYGYDYSGHQTMKYYFATQELIWEKISGRAVGWIYGEDRYGPQMDIENEKNTILNLVNNHTKRPSFDDEIYEVNVGESLTINDTNGVLNQYEIYESDFENVSINGNTLSIDNITSVETGEISLIKKGYTDKVNLIYYNGDSQKMIRAGLLDPVVSSFTVDVNGGTITLKKLDKDTGEKAQGDATLKGAKYYVINSAGETVDILVSGQNEKTKELPFDTYTVREVSAGTGYLVDDTVYTFTLNSDNQEVVFTAYDKVFTQEFKIYKVYASDKTAELIGEPDITFDFYLKSSNELYKSATTDNKGHLSIYLPYGTYIVKQKNSTYNYEKCDDFEINIDFDNTDLTRMISDAEITAKLKLIKIDKTSGKQIAKSGIKFKIKNLDENKYVCQEITYPNHQTICEYETDNNGEFITPYPLRPANYQIEELDQKIDGYLWNREPVKFTISEDSNFIYEDEQAILKVKFSNTEVKGQLELTKYGEEFAIKGSENLLEVAAQLENSNDVNENNSDEVNNISYQKILLNDVSFKLIANEDIYSSDGTLILRKNDIVKTFKTVNGTAIVGDLYLGKYCVIEEETVLNHILDKEPHCFELKYKDQYTSVISNKLELNNELPKGNLIISKTDISTSEPIPNTLLEIYTEDNMLVFSGRTDENGDLEIDNLVVGKYYFVEKEAAKGYVLNTEKMYFEIKENGEIVKSEITNEKISGTLILTKVDISTQEPLPNTLIEIYDAETDELIFSDRTDENGIITVENLKYGKYYFIEKEAPEGYEINPEKMYFEIKENGEIVKSTLEDSKIIEVPNTSRNELKIRIIIGILLVILGIGVVIYANKKKK